MRRHASGHVKTWIAVIGGFRQSSWSGGLSRLWERLRRTYASDATAVTAHAWNDDWRGLAGMMREANVEKVIVVAYSWGVGHGAMTLARELKSVGLGVDLIVSCDGVAHPRFLKIRAVFNYLLPPPRISVPANVHRLHYIRQDTNNPRGHRFASENGTTLINHGLIDHGFTHQDADDSAQFHSMAIELVRREFYS